MSSVQIFLPKDGNFFLLVQNVISSLKILFLNANNMKLEVDVCKDNIHPILAQYDCLFTSLSAWRQILSQPNKICFVGQKKCFHFS